MTIALVVFALVALELPALGWSAALATPASQADAPLDFAVKALSREARAVDDGADPDWPQSALPLASAPAAASLRWHELASQLSSLSPPSSPRQRPQEPRAPPAA